MSDKLEALHYPRGSEQDFHQHLQQAGREDGRYHHDFATACDGIASPRWLHQFNHRHYPAIAEIMSELANRYGMNYRCIGYRKLLVRQRRFLRQMGQSPVTGAE